MNDLLPEGVTSWRWVPDRRRAVGAQRAVGWLGQRWLLLVNVALGLTVAGAVLVPALDALGLDAAGGAIRSAYLLICPQRPSHSFFVFGHQMALEQRMVTMAAAQFIGGLVYAARRGRIHPLGWVPFAALTLPIAWDGSSQLIGLRDSDWFTRSWTGGLFALAFVAFSYPRVDRALRLVERCTVREGAERR